MYFYLYANQNMLSVNYKHANEKQDANLNKNEKHINEWNTLFNATKKSNQANNSADGGV